MNCRSAESLFSSYIEDEISQEERRHLEAHVMGCRRCSLGLREVRATMSILNQELPLVAPSAHFDEDVYAKIRSGEGLRPTARELIQELLAPFRPWVAASVGVSAAVVAFALSPFGQTMLHTAASNGHVTQRSAGIAIAPAPAPSADRTPPAASTGLERILAERTGSSGPAASPARRPAPVMASTALRSSTEPDSIVDGRIPRQRYTDEIINDQFYLDRGLEGRQNPSVVPVNETQDDGVYIVF